MKQPRSSPPAKPVVSLVQPDTPRRLAGDPLEGWADEMVALSRRMQTMLDEIKSGAGEKIAARVAFELPGAIDRMVRQRDRRIFWFRVASTTVALVVAFGAGWAAARYGL